MVWKMSSPALEAFLSTAVDLRASDLHIIAGVPPAFRVNGDILFGDHDALSAEETAEVCTRSCPTNNARPLSANGNSAFPSRTQPPGAFGPRFTSATAILN